MAASESIVLLNISDNGKQNIVEISRSDGVRDNRQNVEQYWNIPSISISSGTARERNSFKNANVAVAKSTDFVCSYCAYHHKLESKLILHVGSHFVLEASADARAGSVMKYDEAGKKFICSSCPRVTTDWTCFREHMRHHLYKMPYRCNICLQPVSSVMQARKHFKIHPQGDLAFTNDSSTGILNELMQYLHPRAPPVQGCLKLFVVDDSSVSRNENCHEIPAHVKNVTAQISVQSKKSVTAKSPSKNFYHMYKCENSVFVCKRCSYKTRISGAFRSHVSQDIHNAWAIGANDSSVGELPVSSTTESVVCGLMEILSHIARSGKTKDLSQPIGTCTQSTVKSRLQQSVQDVFALGHPSDERKLHKNQIPDKTQRIGPELQLVRPISLIGTESSSRHSQQACHNSLELSLESSIKSSSVQCVTLSPETYTGANVQSADIDPLSPIATKPDFSDMYVLIPDRSPLPQKCELCSFTCSNPEQLDYHQKKAHCNKNKATDFSCPECPQKTNKIDILLWHLAHHPGEHTIQYYLCKACKYSSMQLTDITKHEQAYHAGNKEHTVLNTEIVSYRHNLPQCPICSQSLLWKNIFINHFRDAHNLPELKNYLDAKYTSHNCPEKLEFPRSLLGNANCTDGSSNNGPASEPECNKAVRICRFHCDFCTFSTDKKDLFSAHQMMHKDAVVTTPTSLHEPAVDKSNCKRKHGSKRQMFTGAKKLSNSPVPKKCNQKAKTKTSGSLDQFVLEEKPSSTKVLTENPLANFMESLPRKQVFAADVKCPLCSFSTRVRHNILRHIQRHGDESSSMVENQVTNSGLSFGLWLPDALSNKSSTAPVGETVQCFRENQNVTGNRPIAGSSSSKQCSGRNVTLAESANTGENGVPGDGAELEKLSSAPSKSSRFKCEICQMEYSFETDLQKHISDQHPGPYVCHVCDVQLWQKGKMYRHYTVEHPNAAIVLQVLPKDDIRQREQCSTGNQMKMSRTSAKQPSISQSADVPAVSQMSTASAESVGAMVHSTIDPTKSFVHRPPSVNRVPSPVVATYPPTDVVSGGTRTLPARGQEEGAVTTSATQFLDDRSEPDDSRRSNVAAVTTGSVGSSGSVSAQLLNVQSPDVPRPDVTQTLQSMLPAACNTSVTASVDDVLPAVAAGLVPILTDVILKSPEITPGLVAFMTQLSRQQQHQQLASALQTAQPLLSSLAATLNTTVRAESTCGQTRIDLPNDALLAANTASNDSAEAGGPSELRSNAAAAAAPHLSVGQRHHSMIELSDNITDTCSRVRSLSPSEVSVTSTIASFLRAVSKSAPSGSSGRDSDCDSGVAPTQRKRRRIHKRALSSSSSKPSSLSSSRSSMSSPLKPSYILYSCNLCRFATRNLVQYGRHLHQEFSAGAKRRITAERCSPDDESVCLYCHHCSYRTFIQDEFNQHVTAHIVPGKNVKCVYCSFAGSTAQAVRSHMTREHPASTFAVSRERQSRSREKSPAIDLKPVVKLVDVLKLNPVEIQKIKRRNAVRRIDVDLSCID